MRIELRSIALMEQLVIVSVATGVERGRDRGDWNCAVKLWIQQLAMRMRERVRRSVGPAGVGGGGGRPGNLAGAGVRV